MIGQKVLIWCYFVFLLDKLEGVDVREGPGTLEDYQLHLKRSISLCFCSYGPFFIYQ